MSAWTLCIDFGTAYSKAAAAPEGAWTSFRPQEVRPLMVGSGDGNTFLLESAVFVDEDRVLFGRAAVARADALARDKRMALRSFKTILSVSDLDRALNTNAPASIDPHRIFQMRDLVVLYLAYLLSSVDRAVAQDTLLAKAERISYRYAAPAWRRGDSTGAHDSILRLFGEAEAFRAAAGKKLSGPEGMAIKAISDLLPKATAAARAFEMGLIFEATAAAAYTSIGMDRSSSHLIVLDMGAGTTDIAALAQSDAGIVELPDARVTLKQAGDFVDRVIANRAISAAGWFKGDQQALWAALMRHMRDLKETLFAEGRVIFRHEGRNITLAMKDIERDADFKAFSKELEQTYAHGLAVVRADAAARKRDEVQAVAVGGGAHAPFIQELVRRKPSGRGPRVVARPATPDWAHAPAFQGNLAPVFPQLAIAIGGALAPDAMLAVRGVSPGAGGQTGIPAAHD
jgi:molecular chaperone DnaK (HSP70)